MKKNATIVLVVMLALLAGCSKKQGGTTSDATTISKAELIERSDPICATANERLKEIRATGDPTKATEEDLDGWSSYFTAAMQIVGKMVADLHALPDPNEDAAAFGDVVQKRADVLDSLMTIEKAADEGDLDAFKGAIGGVDAADKALLAASSDYGFTDCAA